jgi:hypothetical protein
MTERHINWHGRGGGLRTLTVETEAGIVRINTALRDTRTGHPSVVVEVNPIDGYGPAWAEAQGVWETDVVRGPGRRIDVVLTRMDRPDHKPATENGS